MCRIFIKYEYYILYFMTNKNLIYYLYCIFYRSCAIKFYSKYNKYINFQLINIWQIIYVEKIYLWYKGGHVDLPNVPTPAWYISASCSYHFDVIIGLGTLTLTLGKKRRWKCGQPFQRKEYSFFFCIFSKSPCKLGLCLGSFLLFLFYW